MNPNCLLFSKRERKREREPPKSSHEGGGRMVRRLWVNFQCWGVVLIWIIVGQGPCVYSNSRNDVPRVVQRYGTIAAHTRRRASVLVVFVMYSFAGLIRRTPPPTFSDTAITDRHPDTTNSSSKLTGCGYPGLLDRKNCSDMCPRWESNPRLPACKASTLSTRPGSPLAAGKGLLRLQ